MTDLITPTVTQHDGVTLVTFGEDSDSIYENAIQSFKDGVLQAVGDAPNPLVVVDMQHTKFFGSAFLAFLITVRNAIKDRDGARLIVAGLTPYCRTVVEMSQLDEIWELRDSAEAAVTELNEAV